MAVQLTGDGKCILGDNPYGGTSATLARTVNSIREEPFDGAIFQTWVTTDQGVAVAFAGKQGAAIWNLVKDKIV